MEQRRTILDVLAATDAELAHAQPDPNHRYTVDEFFHWTKRYEGRLEYEAGVITAMVGGTPAHALVIGNTTIALGRRLKKPCRLYNGDLHVHIDTADAYKHPDLAIVCTKPEAGGSMFNVRTKLNPRVLVEVLSPSTEKEDRTHKFDLYQQVPGFEEYVLIDPEMRRVETLRRAGDGGWSLMYWMGTAASARIRSLNLDLPLSEIFDGLDKDASDVGMP